ncbi:hypothetical protein [Brachyspira aalborgi]|nr:hypothetical protein [Brachyspira aalborgi]
MLKAGFTFVIGISMGWYFSIALLFSQKEATFLALFLGINKE